MTFLCSNKIIGIVHWCLVLCSKQSYHKNFSMDQNSYQTFDLHAQLLPALSTVYVHGADKITKWTLHPPYLFVNVVCTLYVEVA